MSAQRVWAMGFFLGALADRKGTYPQRKTRGATLRFERNPSQKKKVPDMLVLPGSWQKKSDKVSQEQDIASE